MSNRKFLLLMIVCVTFFALSNASVFSQTMGKINLSKNIVNIPVPAKFCRPEHTVCEGKEDGLTIEVDISVEGFKDNELNFEFIVSGGKIIKKDSNIIWDLTDTLPGTYKISAVIKNKLDSYVGKTSDEYIIVHACVCGDYFCPSDLKILTKSVKAGEPIIFTAQLDGYVGDSVFEWEVSKGKIIKGIETSSIMVATTPDMAGQKVKATLRVTDNVGADCLLEESVTVNIEKENSAVDVESLTLDKDFAVIGCPPSWNVFKSDSECFDENELLIIVSTKIPETQKDKDLEYYYTVSGGEISGKGAEVIWNLRGEREGKYTITVGVGKDFIISGKTLTKTIELVECTCHPICECLEGVKILGPSNPVKAGSLVIFKIETIGALESPVYKWSVSNGEIIEGKDKSQILVRTSSSENNLEVKIEILHGDCELCEIQTATKSIQLIKN